MARSVSLSDEAFLALREEKREGESDSDVVLRLRREARAKRKDPDKFFKGKSKFTMTVEEFLEFRAKMNAADVAHAERLERYRREGIWDPGP